MTAASSAHIAAVDWGTSNMRIWLLDADGGVVAERRSDDGMTKAGEKGFGAVLEAHLATMHAPADIAVVVCGMAGARQGWIDAGYVQLPATLSTCADAAVKAPGIGRDVRILPGLSQLLPPDVMRGEETQLAGVPVLQQGEHLVCMPGTHSKWVEIADGSVTGFRTAMTGELFALVASGSILRYSLGATPAQPRPDDAVFVRWLDEALAHPAALTSLLFRIRASSLLDRMSPQDAAAALSGLLIGAEIAAAQPAGASKRKVVLVASGALADLYGTALRHAGHPVERVEAECAVRAGLFAAAQHLFDGGRAP